MKEIIIACRKAKIYLNLSLTANSHPSLYLATKGRTDTNIGIVRA